MTVRSALRRSWFGDVADDAAARPWPFIRTEICWRRAFAAPPQPGDEDHDAVNAPYRDWLHRTFGVTIPATALEIVREPARMGDRNTRDPFCRWVDSTQEA